MQVVAVALEEVVWTNGKHDVEIAARAAEASGFAFAGVADAGAVFDAGRDLDLHRELAGDAGFAAGGGAGVGDDGAGAAAVAAGAGYGEEALLIAELAA